MHDLLNLGLWLVFNDRGLVATAIPGITLQFLRFSIVVSFSSWAITFIFSLLHETSI